MTDQQPEPGAPEDAGHEGADGEDSTAQQRSAHPAADALEKFAAAAAEAPPRARRRTARPRGRTVYGSEASSPQGPARVRGTVEEGPASPGAPSPEQPQAAPEPPLLDGAGSPLTPPPPPTTQPEPVAAQHSTGSPVVDPAVFLVAAVRSYLDGLDAHGAAHPVTEDRLLRLRETLARFDDEQPA